MTIIDLLPFAQGSASSLSEVGDVTAGQVDPIVTVGGGSVSDGSDASYVEIGARYDLTIASSHLEILTADFRTDGVPVAMGLQIRGSTPAATLASPPVGARYLWTVYTSIADGSYIDSFAFSSSVFDPLTYCYEPSPTTLETYRQQALDRSDPTFSGYWGELEPMDAGGGTVPGGYEALTGEGIRVSVFIDHFTTGTGDPPPARVPWVNVHELRLVVAGEFDVPPVNDVWFASPIRQRQRADGLGLSSASRTSQLRTKQGSLRGGPNGVD